MNPLYDPKSIPYFIYFGVFCILLSLLISIFWNVQNEESFFTNGCKKSALDIEARKGQDCKPIKTINGPFRTIIQIVPPSCESGLPHTIDSDTIVMTEQVYRSSTFKQTFIHELIHILQRRDLPKWKNFFEKEWNFSFSGPGFGVQIPSSVFTDQKRFNPDVCFMPDGTWNGWTVMEIYKDPTKPAITDSKNVWILGSGMTEEPPLEWRDFFGNSLLQQEHPLEISAEMATKYYSGSAAVKGSGSPAFKKLVLFLEQNYPDFLIKYKDFKDFKE